MLSYEEILDNRLAKKEERRIERLRREEIRMVEKEKAIRFLRDLLPNGTAIYSASLGPTVRRGNRLYSFYLPVKEIVEIVESDGLKTGMRIVNITKDIALATDHELNPIGNVIAKGLASHLVDKLSWVIRPQQMGLNHKFQLVQRSL